MTTDREARGISPAAAGEIWRRRLRGMTWDEILDTATRHSPELHEFLASAEPHHEGVASTDLRRDVAVNGTDPPSSPLVIVIHGPSGVGKDTVIDRLRDRLNIHRATSSTSRPPRHYEEDGVHYHFLSPEDFERKIGAGDFIEYAKVYDQWKGVERAEIEGPLARGEDVIIRTDVQGARTWREKLEGGIFVFLMAEDREALRARLIERGSEDEDSLAIRIAELEEELSDVENNDYVVINRHGRLDDAIDEIADIIQRERLNPDRPPARLLP